MSKWLFPTQDWGKVTKQPLVTRVHGVKGDEQARAVSQYFQGPINHFLAAQTQQRANNGLDVYKSRTRLPHLILSYAYIHGQEYLDVWVSDEARHEALKVKRYHDVLLVTLDYDDMWGISATHSAYMSTPQLQTLPTVDGVPVRGVSHEDAVTFADDGTTLPVVLFPQLQVGHAYYQLPFVTPAAAGKQRSTVMIDTRPITNLPVYMVDIYYSMGVSSQRDSTCRLAQWNFNHETTTPTEYALLREFQSLLSINGGGAFTNPDDFYIPLAAAPSNEDWATFPTLPNSGFTYTPFPPPITDVVIAADFPDFGGEIDFTSLGFGYQELGDPSIGTSHYQGEMETHPLPTHPATSGNYEWTVQKSASYTGKYFYDPIGVRDPGPPVTRDVKVTAAWLSSPNDLGISHTSGSETIDDHTICGTYGLGMDFHSWEVRGAYPKQPVDFNLGTAKATSTGSGTGSSIAQHRNRKPLCRIIFDRERDTVSMAAA